ncbi:MAG: FG-GAP-like repeat-containing protein [Pirellulales bacterium]
MTLATGRPRRRVWLLALAFAAVVVAVVARGRLQKAAVESDYAVAKQALAGGHWRHAIEFGERLAASPSRRVEGLLIAGEAYARQQQPEQALACLQQVPQDGSPLACSAQLAEAEVHLQLRNCLGAAERCYAAALELEPNNVVALERLAYVLGLQGRTREAAVYRLALLRHQRVLPVHLVLLAIGDTADENPETAERFWKSFPTDPAALRAMGTVERKRKRLADARRRLESAVRAEPLVWSAQAALGQVLLELPDDDSFEQWRRDLPEGYETSSEIWTVLGQHAARTPQASLAASCFAEAVRIDPNHLAALHHLGRTLKSLDQLRAADAVLDRAKQLEQFATAARTYQISGSSQAVELASQHAEQLGLAWEAWAWSEIAQKKPASDRQRLRDLANSSPLQRTLASVEVLAALDRAKFPGPAQRDAVRQANLPATQPPARRTQTPTSAAHSAGFDFTDVASACGINFVFHNGRKSEVAGEYMYEFSGGAAAVLDYDHDGRPDLYFAQGADWPPRDENVQHVDALYRNRPDGPAQSVAAQAHILEQRFSQGVAVGDFDNDGFDDLYVANIGANRLYHNCGDGTFEEVTERAAVAGDDWSTGAALADFNGDGLPDLYVANYLAGERLFDRPCLMADGSTRLCTPHEFAAAQDRLYVNLGDGRFADATDESGVKVPDGKALGLIVADFDDSGRLGVFTANDAVPNFLFMNETDRPGGPLKLVESGLVAGVSVDADGRAQACMGIAAGDADGDGQLDLFVTNFRNEANTLYLKAGPLDWIDSTRSAGLLAPSYELLGFGAQMLDADLDGDEDLLLVNGHVGDLRHHGVPYAMRPQFFENLGGGRFEERRADQAGSFFAGEYLGRGLARLDWNLDGRPDVAVNHLHSPAALVLNQTSTPHRHLAIQLVGTRSPRHPVGAKVEVHTDHGPHRKQLLAGDGYMASNERTLFFGLGDATEIQQVVVHWPAGGQTAYNADQLAAAAFQGVTRLIEPVDPP